MPKLPLLFYLFALPIVFALSPCAFAAEGGDIRILPGGVVFPSLAGSVLGDPADLPNHAGSVIEALVEPNFYGSYGTSTYSANAAFSGAVVGGGFGASMTGTGLYASEDAYAALGLHAQNFGLGANFTYGLGAFSNGLTNFSVGLNYGTGQGVEFAIVAFPLITLGVGYIEPKKYNLELNLTMPNFLSGNIVAAYDYTLSLFSAVYAGMFGVGFSTSYNFSDGLIANGLVYSLDLLCHPPKWPGFLVEMNNGFLTFGVDFIL